MSYTARLDRAFANAPVLPLSEQTPYVLFSDCHRGTGNSNDNFLKNRTLYSAALNHYERSGFTYIELGDGDELWENHCYSRIIDIHWEIFLIFKKMQKENRLYLLYGNHDHCKKNCRYCKKHCSTWHPSYICHNTCPTAASSDNADFKATADDTALLLPDLQFLSALILKNAQTGTELYLTHGHQADFLNSTLAPLSGFLVRWIWKPLEHLGVQDPTSAARNYTRKQTTEKRLVQWARQNHKILITGHTHRPMTGSPASPYFNTGSCVHPESITCIEVSGNSLSLVRWRLDTKADRTLYVKREVLEQVVLWEQ